jgi:transcriptional regulator with XRE-family HTH domain
VARIEKGRTPRQHHFGALVREARHARKLSQEELGFRSGVNRAYIGGLEAGLRNPSLETICRLALALKVDASDLVRGAQKKRGRT